MGVLPPGTSASGPYSARTFLFARDRPAGFLAVEARFDGTEPGNGPAAPGDDDLLAMLDPVEQLTELAFRLEGADLAHRDLLNDLAYRLVYQAHHCHTARICRRRNQLVRLSGPIPTTLRN